jgi:single-strand DNA-binding protein
MASVNKVIVIGNLGADPELSKTKAEKTVCRLSVATTRKWKNQQTGEAMEETEWHRISVWGKQADNCAKYLAKGRAVYVEGRLRTSKYRKEGESSDRYSTEIMADVVQFLGAKGDAPQSQSNSSPPDDDDDDF